MSRMVSQAQTNQVSGVTRGYSYRKSSCTEVFADDGSVETRKEKSYLVQGGKAYLQQMKYNGQSVSTEELKKEERKSAQARQEVTESKNAQRDESWEKYLTGDLTGRYNFTLVGTETVNGRPAYVLTFQPKGEDLPVRKMVDRVLNRMGGKVWVDQQEFEIAKAQLRLQSQATLGGLLKVVGALKRFDYKVERIRVAENAWFNHTTEGDYESRKLWDSSHIRTTTKATDFQRNVSSRN